MYFCIMYYRRKILLSLIELFGGKLDKVSLQKLTLLFTKEQEKPVYHFVPNKFGCYSFQLSADLSALIKYQILDQVYDEFIKIDSHSYIKDLKEVDRKSFVKLKSLHFSQSKDELIQLTYKKYPELAFNSIIINKYLPETEIETIKSLKPISEERALYTIGYEGVSLEEYLNKLIKYDIKVLCDVRKNPLSMKFGFSKHQLKSACESLGIEYIHIPELGIESDKRQQLNCQADYDNLFVSYRKEVLDNTKLYQEKILNLLKDKHRVALTCFEANICQCHRKDLSESVIEHSHYHYKLQHI